MKSDSYFELQNRHIVRTDNQTRIPKLPDGISDLLINHCKIKTIPYSLSGIKNLSIWHSSIENIKELPEGLENLDLSGCAKLRSLPKLPATVESLNLTGCNMLDLDEDLAKKLESSLRKGVNITYPKHFGQDDVLEYKPNRPENHPQKTETINLQNSRRNANNNISCVIA